MNEKELFCLKNLEYKSNAILGFVVLQSLFLCDRIIGERMATRLHDEPILQFFLLIAHTTVVITAFISIKTISKYTKRLLGEMKDDILETQTTCIKLFLVLLFGLLPIVIILFFFILGVKPL